MPAASQPLPVDTLLFDRYRIIAPLAFSQESATYRAWDARARRQVVVKALFDPAAESQRQFRQQVRRLAALTHPQLPAVYDHFFVKESGSYMVAEFIDGVDLQTLLHAYGTLPQDAVIGWLQAVTVPLTFLHQNDNLHLDIKPANIRLTPEGRVTLVDSGLPLVGMAAGSSGYAAPEQQAQRAADQRTDIYALGATLYALLTGAPPVDALQREAGLRDLVPARERNPDVEPYLSLVAARAMSIVSAARFDSAEQFATAIARPANLPAAPSAAPPIAAQRAPARRVPLNRRPRRQMETRTIWALAGVLLLLVGVAAVVGVVGFGPDEPPPVQITQTAQSQLALALTDIAPTPTLSPTPTPTPTPTPQPVIDELSGNRMLYVPSGAFNMGLEESDDASPVHRVVVDAFYIDETEVTNGQYARCVEAESCTPPLSPNATFHPAYYGDPDYDDYPVIFVDWNQANDFCAWRGARLPTEAQWEYAAGYKREIGQMLRFPWGNVLDRQVANFCDANCTTENRNPDFDDGHRDTAPVASYAAGRSPIGAYDMAGNVMEWTADWYDRRYYAESSEINPLGPLQGEAKSLRGGSWLSTIEDLVIAERGSYLPQVARANLGFRCARPIE